MSAAGHSQLSVFRTAIGWFAIVGQDGVLEQLFCGHRSAAEVRERVASIVARDLPDADWNPHLRERLQAYADGAADDFRDIPVANSGGTPFRQRVIRKLRQVGYGHTVSYGELAERAGAPRAARAVGTVMASNRVPIVIPCHRVLAAGGAIGGFSAPQGLDLKRRLLALESSLH